MSPSHFLEPKNLMYYIYMVSKLLHALQPTDCPFKGVPATCTTLRRTLHLAKS